MRERDRNTRGTRSTRILCLLCFLCSVPVSEMSDEQYIRRALELAEKGAGLTSPAEILRVTTTR